MKSKVFTIIGREYLTRVRTKGFIIGTLITPLLLVLVFGGIFIFALLFKPDTKNFHVIDQSEKIFDKMAMMLDDTLSSGVPEFNWVEYKLQGNDLEAAVAELQHQVFSKKIDGYLHIPEHIIQEKKIKYAARSVSDWEEIQKIERTISQIVTDYRLIAKGVSPDSIRAEFNRGRVELITSQVTDEGEVAKSGLSSFVLTYLLAYILFLMIMIYGQMVSRSVIEEKSQRIAETIVSSVKPIELLVGKVTGICLLGLTQLVVIGLFFLLASAYAAYVFMSFGVVAPELLEVVNQINFSVSLFGYLLIYFLLGFFFYAALFAMLGSIVNTEDEAQQMQIVLIMMIIISFFMMFNAAKNPESSMAFWLSIIPFFSPVVGFARVAVSDPMLPNGVFLSVLSLAASGAGTIWLVSKIYRVGILMYGKKPSLKELLRWIRHS